ncbi:MAG: hypothetical protein ACYCU6_06975, partial [Acidimicrobiales bacterium]
RRCPHPRDVRAGPRDLTACPPNTGASMAAGSCRGTQDPVAASSGHRVLITSTSTGYFSMMTPFVLL